MQNESNFSKKGIAIFIVLIATFIATPILGYKLHKQGQVLDTLKAEKEVMQEEKAVMQEQLDHFKICTLHVVECDFEREPEPWGDDEPWGE